MTKYLKWGIATRLVALVGFLVVMASEWMEPLASSPYSSVVLVLGFVLGFIGVFAGRGMFMFKRIYARLEQEELERINKERNGV